MFSLFLLLISSSIVYSHHTQGSTLPNAALHLRELNFDGVPDDLDKESGILIVCLGISTEGKPKNLRDCRYVHDVLDVNVTTSTNIVLEESITWPTHETQLSLVLRVPNKNRKWIEFSYKFLHKFVPHQSEFDLTQIKSGVTLTGGAIVNCLNGFTGPGCHDLMKVATAATLKSENSQIYSSAMSTLPIPVILVVVAVGTIFGLTATLLLTVLRSREKRGSAKNIETDQML